MNPLNRKGIILAGGNGTRLFPSTKVTSKQLLPVYDKPLIYYPMSTLMLSGIKDILIICKKIDENSFKNLFGDGSKLGLNIEYKVQNRPDGIAQAYHLGESFLKGSPSVLILGDNIFHGRNFDNTLKEANSNPKSTIFSYKVSNPESYGVVESNNNNKILSLDEKPVNPKSNEALVGLYFLDETAVDLSQSLLPSKRGELEITDLIQKFIDKGTINLEKLDSGFAWYDAGTSESLLEASQYFLGLEKRQSLKSACIEETAFKEQLITKSELVELIKEMPSGDYNIIWKKFMLVKESPLSGVFIIEPKIHEDERGYFFESYNKKDLEKHIPNIPNFVQDNISFSKKNVLRGLHYQEHNSQAKLIKVIHGEIFDVAVNVDKKSHQYMNYFSIILNDSNNKQLYIPENFAHGFLVLSDSAQVSYKTSNFYDAKSEKTISWNDKKIGIDWPIKTKPFLSKKDDFK